MIYSCRPSGYDIRTLDKRELTFKELPTKIQKVLYDPSDFKEESETEGFESLGIKSIICLEKECNYIEESVSYIFGQESWIDYTLLTDTIKDRSYEIKREISSRPYIIYDNKLYIPNEYNIFTVVEDIETVKFMCYQLK
ncbi:MAG: hypothetical protein ACK5MD_00180 [Flavobacteriales bacterium]